MRHLRLLVSIIVVSASLIPALAQNQAAGSLPRDTIAKFVPSPFGNHHEAGETATSMRSRHGSQYLILRVAHEPRYVAILEIHPNGSLKLNPDGFDYGSLPGLKKMNPLAVDALLGSPTSVVGNVRKYGLMTSSDKKCTLDISFENELANQYRLHYSALSSTYWSKLD